MNKIISIMAIVFVSFSVLASEETTLMSVYRDAMQPNFEPNQLWGKEIYINLPYKITMCFGDVCLASDYGFNFDDIYLTKTPNVYVGMDLMGKKMKYDGINMNFMTFKIK